MTKSKFSNQFESKWGRERAENMRLMLKAWDVERVARIFKITSNVVIQIVKDWEEYKAHHHPIQANIVKKMLGYRPKKRS